MREKSRVVQTLTSRLLWTAYGFPRRVTTRGTYINLWTLTWILLQSYDGGISDAPYHEAQAGFTYCAIGALSNINRLPSPPYAPVPTSSSPKAALNNPTLLIKWLVSRQTATISEEDELDTYGDETDTPETCHDAHSFVYQDKFVSKQGEMNYEGRPSVHFSLEWTGFNGRCNKIADTCYAFWVHGSLCVSIHPDLASGNELERLT